MDIHEACLVLESIKDNLDDLSNEDLIDLTARVSGLRKTCEFVEEHTKTIVIGNLNLKEGEKRGELRGNLFKACLILVSFDQIDVKRLKAERPDIFEAYKTPCDQERITYKTR